MIVVGQPLHVHVHNHRNHHGGGGGCVHSGAMLVPFYAALSDMFHNVGAGVEKSGKEGVWGMVCGVHACVCAKERKNLRTWPQFLTSGFGKHTPTIFVGILLLNFADLVSIH